MPRKPAQIRVSELPSHPTMTTPDPQTPPGPPQLDPMVAIDLNNAILFATQDRCNCLSSRILREKIAPVMFKDLRKRYEG